MARRAGAWLLALGVLALSTDVGAGFRTDVGAGFSRPRQAPSALQSDLSRIFADPVLSRALLAARVESLRDGRVLYAQNDDKLVVPASNMKVLTLAVAADRLGWDYRFETRLEASGAVSDGVGILHGDLIVVGGGDPSIRALGSWPAPVFVEWANLLARAGVRRVDGRLVGDDNAFDDQGLGRGWSWDDLGEGYAAASGALSYNENVATLRISPARAAGDPAAVEIGPPGHGLQLANQVKTGEAGSAVSLGLARRPGERLLTARGTVPAGGAVVTRNASVDNPTQFFVEELRSALLQRGIVVTGGAWDIDDLPESLPAAGRQVLDRHMSPPLSSLAGSLMKPSQNFYAETFVKALGRAAAGTGTTVAGRGVVLETLASWGVAPDAVVFVDGSGLSRYNYVTTGALVIVLKRMWADDRFRGAFAASLPVAGHDGTLETRMRGTVLDARVQAKTGTISNVRSLSGYLETRSGDRLVFSIIANHFTAPSSQVDAVVERALSRLAED